MQILLIEAASGQHIVLDVEASDTIITVKQKVQNEEYIPLDMQCLMSNGKELEDDCTLTDCNIQGGSRLLLVLRRVKISVKAPAGLKRALQADASDTIWDVLRRLAATFKEEEVHTATIQPFCGGGFRLEVNGPK